MQPPKETFHFINDPAEAIHEASLGLTETHPSLCYSPEYKTIYRQDIESFRQEHVTTIGFAGGGHEPMFSGFVGHSFLTCSVSGSVFASPTAAQIFHAIQLCQGSPPSPSSKGTLIVCGNYTGDILNAGLAITRANAAGYKVKFVPVGDDVAVGRKKGGKVGRRGLSGHLVALKIACAVAEKGESLDRVSEVMECVIGRTGTIGVAFDRVALPNDIVTDIQMLPQNTIELGMGAHGEPGLKQLSPIPDPVTLTKTMLELLTNIDDSDRGFIPFKSQGNEVVMLVNSLGGTNDEVLARFADLAIGELEKQGIKVKRLTLGPMVTSLKMSGFSITLWLLPSREEKDVLGLRDSLDCWDRAVNVVAWRQ